MTMLHEIALDAENRMKRSIEALSSELAKLRTGRAHPSLVGHVMVPYYDVDTPLNQVANVNVLDARTLGISPWEKHMIPTIEKAVMSANLGLNPVTVGDIIRVPLPQLTEERRKELVKLVRQEGENARVAIRNIRRDANNTAKDLLKEKEITEDEDRRAHDRVQKITDKYIAEVDAILNAKEKDLMEI